MVLKQEMVSYKHLMMNVAVDWYTNTHTVNNGGHSSSLEY
jgi:hypothetical protein